MQTRFSMKCLLAAALCTGGCTLPFEQLFSERQFHADAGAADAGEFLEADAGPYDAGLEDAGPYDAGLEDAGPIDAGLEDAGPIDAGPPVVVTYLSDAGALIVGVTGTCTQLVPAYRQRPVECGDGGRCLIVKRSGEPARALASMSLNGFDPQFLAGANDGWVVFQSQQGTNGLRTIAARRFDNLPTSATVHSLPVRLQTFFDSTLTTWFWQFPTGVNRQAIDFAIGDAYGVHERHGVSTKTTPPTWRIDGGTDFNNIYWGGPYSNRWQQVRIFDPTDVDAGAGIALGSLVYVPEIRTTSDAGLVFEALAPAANIPSPYFSTHQHGAPLDGTFNFDVSRKNGSLVYVMIPSDYSVHQWDYASVWVAKPGDTSSRLLGTYAFPSDPSYSEGDTLLDFTGRWLYYLDSSHVFRIDLLNGKYELLLVKGGLAPGTAYMTEGGIVARAFCSSSTNSTLFINTNALTATWLEDVGAFPAAPVGNYQTFDNRRLLHSGTDTFWIDP